jgi:hypothetical protein
VQLPSVSSPPAGGPVLNTTVQTGFTYQGAGAPAIPTNPIEYAWAETNDVRTPPPTPAHTRANATPPTHPPPHRRRRRRRRQQQAGCTTTDIPNAASSNVSARILALTSSLTFSFWVPPPSMPPPPPNLSAPHAYQPACCVLRGVLQVRESYPFRAFQYCSVPGSVQVQVSGDAPYITDLTSSINDISNNTGTPPPEACCIIIYNNHFLR